MLYSSGTKAIDVHMMLCLCDSRASCVYSYCCVWRVGESVEALTGHEAEHSMCVDNWAVDEHGASVRCN